MALTQAEKDELAGLEETLKLYESDPADFRARVRNRLTLCNMALGNKLAQQEKIRQPIAGIEYLQAEKRLLESYGVHLIAKRGATAMAKKVAEKSDPERKDQPKKAEKGRKKYDPTYDPYANRMGPPEALGPDTFPDE